MKRLVMLCVVLLVSGISRGDLRLPLVISDHMVLQRDKPVPIWGQADAGATVQVTFAGQSRSTQADGAGKWRVTFDAMPASTEPRSMTITAAQDTRTLGDILVGEVWLCSGQSNMEKPLVPQRGQQNIPNMDAEIAAADFANIRLVVVPRPPARPSTSAASQASTAPATRPAPVGWAVCNPDNVKDARLSAVAYFFGREVHQKINVPVGLLQSSIGGTRIEPWTPLEGFDQVASLKPFADAIRAGKREKVEDTIPASLYQPMIAPLAPYAIRGAIWYQGESNHVIHDGPRYTEKMKALVGGWRAVWGQGDFPFYYVQIAPHVYSNRKATPPIRTDELPEFWMAQSRAMDEIRNSGMVVINDLVDNVKDIHPPRKLEVGQRLAAWALSRDYGHGEIDPMSPIPTSAVRDGKKVVIQFDHADGGLVCPEGDVRDLQIVASDGTIVAAKGQVDGGKLIVWADSVETPVSVRFAWSETATPNLSNKSRLPVACFSINVK